ncbi:amino acid ABC transporter permease [Jannaschia seohaensis]|uniref:Polar amino acid transport system permease protein n=1 Tax=Jannaschia seohaensis TaxID=475081 RepID=A0A2Y9A9W6_9RHOB|nr:amino acid ABC transporter permease [Jannaschia seohaensis]PWJ20911.1 polar amino acid transport system permease protein [Jannaschia seohaensis]SSA41321.1 polar amino acid transport system permease protein [Jannaschia seohaensis]
MDAILQQFFNWGVMAQALPLLLKGLGMTLLICAVVIPLGALGGLLAALASTAQARALRWSAIAFVDLFRALPPLVLLIFIYAGLPFAGLRLSPFAAVTIAFFLNNSAYFAEIFRAGLLSVPKGQAEAALSTGLTPAQTLIWVRLPQATRNVLPDLLSNVVEIVKLTSLASVVSLGEMLHAADLVRSVTYNASPLILAAGLYLLLLWPLVRLIGRFERRIAG